MLKKFIAYEFSLEVLLIFVVFICLAVLLIKTVIPNFGAKSVVVSWFTMLTALIIFAYSIFVELKEESATSSLSTYSCFTDDGKPRHPVVPPGYSTNCEVLWQLSAYLNPAFEKVPNVRVPDLGAELMLVNILSYLANDYIDWKSKIYSSPSSTLILYRKEDMAGKDKVTFLDAILRESKFEFFDFSLEKRQWGQHYFLLPPLTDVYIDGSKVVFRNPHFLFEAMVIPLGHVYRMEHSGSFNIWVTDYNLEIRYHLFKSRSGHWHRSDYHKLCQSLSENLKARFEVKAGQWPISKGWSA